MHSRTSWTATATTFMVERAGAGGEAALASASHSSHRTLNSLQHRLEVIGAVMAHAVNEEGRRAIHTAADAAHKLLTHARGMDVPGQLAAEPGDIEAQRGRILQQVTSSSAC